MYNYLAGGQPENITHRQKSRRRHHKNIEQKIWTRKSAHYQKRQSIRIPRNDIGLLDKRQVEKYPCTTTLTNS